MKIKDSMVERGCQVSSMSTQNKVLPPLCNFLHPSKVSVHFSTYLPWQICFIGQIMSQGLPLITMIKEHLHNMYNVYDQDICKL